MPHFLSISWLYREDYKQAGFVMLASFDPECRVTGRQSLLYTMGLLSVSFLPAMLNLTSFWYLPVAMHHGRILPLDGISICDIRNRSSGQTFVCCIDCVFAGNAWSARFCPIVMDEDFRKKNRRLLIAIIVFAVGLTVLDHPLETIDLSKDLTMQAPATTIDEVHYTRRDRILSDSACSRSSRRKRCCLRG